MEKVDTLSNMTIGKLDTNSITDFFETIKAVENQNTSNVKEHVIKASELREDVVKSTSDEDKALIMSNFPKQQGTYLVVPKIIQ